MTQMPFGTLLKFLRYLLATLWKRQKSRGHT